MSIVGKILLSALTGTACMTLYSYSISKKEKKQFREPELLNELLDGMEKDIQLPEEKSPFGFVLHYVTGIGFVVSYIPIWQKMGIKPNWENGLVIGFVSGVVGVSIWEATLQLHPNPPKVDKLDYYGHLLIAHAIFGTAASAQWQLME